MDSILRARVGIGFDVHPFCDGRPCIIGGVDMKYSKGLQGHSDADVLVHAIIDSLLGAASLGDIGHLFPDTDHAYKGANSLLLLQHVHTVLEERGIAIINIDSVVICEEPEILPLVHAMKANIAQSLGGLSPQRIGIKGTTTEQLGFTGRKEGIAAQAVSLILMPTDYS